MLKEDENLAVKRKEFDSVLQRFLATKPLKRADIKPLRKTKSVKQTTLSQSTSHKGAGSDSKCS
jgi:hypothetical protein